MLVRFLNDEDGATSVEYTLIIFLVSIVCIVGGNVAMFFYLMGVGVGVW